MTKQGISSRQETQNPYNSVQHTLVQRSQPGEHLAKLVIHSALLLLSQPDAFDDQDRWNIRQEQH